MNFQNPSALWLALLIPLIILLYLLKLRREERIISSTYLWQRMVQDRQANAPWQRLQRNLLLFLQLLFLIVLILAIAQPTRDAQGINSRTLVLIFDTSASMAARDGAPTRLEAARQQALQIVDNLPTDARITVLTAEDSPRTLISLSTDRRFIRQVINQIQVGSEGSDMKSALQIAAAVAQRRSDTQIVILSDGNVELPDRSGIDPSMLHFITIGSRSENQAIELLTLQANPSDQTLTIFAQIANYSPDSVKRRVAFYADGAPVSVTDLEIAPNSEQSILASDILSDTILIEARLLPSTAVADGLAPPVSAPDYLDLDDRAYAVVRQSEPLTITLVGNGNLFLETALSLIPGVRLTLLKPDEVRNLLQPENSSTENDDNLPTPVSGSLLHSIESGNPALIIFDQVIPDQAGIPKTNLLMIAPLQSSFFFTVTDQITLPVPTAVEPIDPIIENVELSGVNILDASELTLAPWVKPLIEDATSPRPRPPLLAIGEKDGRRVAVLAFSLNHSDLPLQVAFPILFSQLIAWLTPGQTGPIPVSLSPGVPLVLTGLLPTSHPDNGGPFETKTISEDITITRPDGIVTSLDLQSGELIFADTSQLGVYQVNFGDNLSIPFVVNLFSPEESRIAPQRMAISKIPAATGNAPSRQNETTQNSPDNTYPREFWRWVAGLAALILFVEWLVHFRPTVTRIAHQILAWLNPNKRSIL